jgi:hypothetical protein
MRNKKIIAFILIFIICFTNIVILFAAAKDCSDMGCTSTFGCSAEIWWKTLCQLKCEGIPEVVKCTEIVQE